MKAGRHEVPDYLPRRQVWTIGLSTFAYCVPCGVDESAPASEASHCDQASPCEVREYLAQRCPVPTFGSGGGAHGDPAA